ncbi:acyl-CoA dehydrogenase family protein [Nocardioides sambongensis]
MPAERLMPTPESEDLIELTRAITERELLPLVAQAERDHAFPREAFRTLGRSGLLGLPYPEEYGGGDQPYEVYLQVVEEIATAWAAVGVGTSVHALSCFGLFHAGTEEQKQQWLPDMLGVTCSAPTACPRPTRAPTPRRCAPVRSARATSTS